jgi:uncharacterized membrane protein
MPEQKLGPESGSTATAPSPSGQPSTEQEIDPNRPVLVLARFPDTDVAINVYEDLRQAEAMGSLRVDGTLIVEADENGKLRIRQMTDHSTRTGLKWGIVGGAVAAVFLPATIVGGAVALGIAGATAGKARNQTRRNQVKKELEAVIEAGTCGLLCLTIESSIAGVIAAMPWAQAIKTIPIDDATADAVKAAARAAGSEAEGELAHRYEGEQIPW